MPIRTELSKMTDAELTRDFNVEIQTLEDDDGLSYREIRDVCQYLRDLKVELEERHSGEKLNRSI